MTDGRIPWFRFRLRAEARRTSPAPLFEDVRYDLGDPGIRPLARPTRAAELHMAALATPLGGLL